MRLGKAFMVGVAALAIAACGKKDAADDGAPAAESAAVAPAEPEDLEKLAETNLAAAERFLTENARRQGVTTTESGLQYEILSRGPEGERGPTQTDFVSVHYVGTLTDGVEFDSSRARGAVARFQLNRVIPGWIEGLQLMRNGDHFRFFIPPDLAYGATGTPGGPIPPNSALIFDVELLDVTNPEINSARARAFFAENAKKPGVKTTASGLQYEVLAEGPAGGATPSDSDVVQVHYIASHLNGAEIENSQRFDAPAQFPLGQAFPGWVEGLQLMTVGDKYRFIMPADLAYGDRGSPDGVIGPGEAFIFEVELLDVLTE
jgi:FKBP-type peptidyl-prolyl cis-trans isomerase